MKDIAELNPHHYPTNPSIDGNLKILFARMLEVQDAFGHDLTVTSGLRSDAQQEQLIKEGKTTAVHSKHLAGAAVDILDLDGSLTAWVKANLDYMAKVGLWMEDFDSIAHLAATHKSAIWVHFQCMAPGSGKRVFIP
jgi:uncharacterized protein YcbK (DUF882 family)